MATILPIPFRLQTGETAAIRSATPDDATALLALTRAAIAERRFLVSLPEEFDLSEADERTWIQQHLDDPGKLLLIAELPGRILGTLSCEAGSRKRLAHRATLHMLIERDWRGRGIGTALLQTLIGWAEEHPMIEKLGLSVFATNKSAIALYRRCGFVEEGRRVRELKLGPGEYVDDILMYRFV